MLTSGAAARWCSPKRSGPRTRAGERPLQYDNVFSIFSVTKAFTNVLILKAIEEGRFALTTKVRDVLPEFTGKPREDATFYHLLTHTAGMPGVWTPKPGMYLDRLQELFEASIENVHGEVPPGTRCDYSPLVNHVLMGTALVRTDPKGRNYQTLLHEDLFAPLGMNDTSMGLRADLAPRHVKPDMRGTVPIKHLSRNIAGDHALFEDPRSRGPARRLRLDAAATSTASPRCSAASGELDGVRILSPAMLRLARQNQTGDDAQRALQARRRERRLGRAAGQPGHRLPGARHRRVPPPVRHPRQPETHGNYGAGSTMFWVDPEPTSASRWCSAGVMTQAANIERCQKLSDLALSAMMSEAWEVRPAPPFASPAEGRRRHEH